MLYVVIVGTELAVGFAAFVVVTNVLERTELRGAMRQLGGYEIEGARQQEMLRPFNRRIVAPVTSGILGLAYRYTPAGYVERIRVKLVLSGTQDRVDVDQFLVMKVVACLAPVLWIPLVFGGLQFSGLAGVAFVAVLTFIGLLVPDLVLNNKIKARQHLIAVQLPDMLDLLVISVEAGLGFDQALERTASSMPGPLAEEFGRMLQETRIGATRADALRALEDRTQVPELRSFILAMLQADTFGVSVAQVLRAQADEMRVRRRIRAQEQAQKAPVKMLFPLVFCIFPSIFVVVLGPALIQLSKNL
ncbi:MAG: type II secretion system F family protein [Actinobacteria bacterium]|nr:type II secretion system F family protein [Actinomycetota bacterium]